MKTFHLLGFGLAAAAFLSAPLRFAASGGAGAATSSFAAAGSGGRAASITTRSVGPQMHGGASAIHGFPAAHNSANFQNPVGFHAPIPTQPHVIAPFNQVTPTSVSRVSPATRTAPLVTTSPTFAFGGRSVAPRTAQIQNRAVEQLNGGWDRSRDRIWHGRHFHWNRGAWVIINDGFYPFSASYYVPSSQEVYPNASYEYDSAAPFSDAPAPSSAVPAPALMPAVAEESIAADVQEILQRRGYYHGEITGVISDTTRGAIADFQKDNDLPITGYITKSLLKALGL